MNANDMQQHLYHVFEAMTLGEDEISIPHELLSDEGVDMVSTFVKAGVLTGDTGIVIRMKDGSRF